MGDRRAIEPLIGALKDGYVPVNLPAAYALVQIGEPVVIPLIKALEDKAKTVRFFSAEILGKIGDRRAVEALINALKDEEADVRHSAAEALGKIGDTMALAALEWLAQNDNGEALWWGIPVRETALKAIQQIKNERI
jgi:HEAT repeat protein